MLMTASVKLIGKLITLISIKKIPNDPTESNRNKVNNTISEFKL